MSKKLRRSLNRAKGGRLSTTIVISDSEDESEVLSATVIPLTAASLAPLTPPPDTSGETPLFYESRLPNDGKDVKPVYEKSSNVLSLEGLSHNSSFPSHNDSIMERPASTPIESHLPNPFEYSLISDTSLQVTTIEDESTLKNETDGEDFLNLEETVVAMKSPESRPKTGAQCEDVDMAQSLEEGEIIDVEGHAQNHDDSVVFVSEEILTPKRKQKLSKKLNMMQVLKEKAEMYRQLSGGRIQQKAIATSTEPLKPPPSGNNNKRRMIIIDGSNVAFAHTENGRFSVRGLELCLQHFISRGFDAKAVVPQFRMKRTQTDNHVKMLELEQRKLLIKTPAKDLAGKFAASYDDRFILNIAKEFDAAVLSNDNYRDLLAESTDFAFIISNRVIGYTWVMDKLFIPDDPYGKIGPNLNQILYVGGDQN